MEIISPANSFVKFNSPEAINNCCTGEQNFCIPVINEDDTFFQFMISGADLTEGDAIFDMPLSDIQLLLLNGNDNNEASIAANTLRNWTVANALQFEKYRTAANGVTFLWRNFMQDISTLLPCDKCFQLAIIATINEENILKGISNCFIHKCGDCFTSVLEYYNYDDYAGFNYCNIDTPLNRVRLPIYLTQPKPIEDQGIYRKSGGKIKQLWSYISKEYLVETEHFPEHIHDKIIVALGHDEKNIIADNYNGGISKNGDYTIDWTDNICKAPANFRATATPYAIRNSNCADCQDVDLSGGSCIPVGYPGEPLPDAFVGLPYNYSFDLTGAAPFVLGTITSKPAWMMITLVGSTVTFSGTPPATESDIAVSFTVTNCAGTSTLNFSQTFDVGDTCHVVTVPEHSLPDAIVGVPYSQSLILGGDPTFILSIISKPAWMSITVSGNTVTFSGTPTDVATDLSIVLNIQNCGGRNQDSFVDSIDVAEAAPTCNGPVEIIVLNDGSNTAEFGWTLAGPYPSGGYEWELYQDTTFINSGTYNDNPNRDLLITGLDPSTNYHIRIRANCGEGDFSDWVDEPFTTTA